MGALQHVSHASKITGLVEMGGAPRLHNTQSIYQVVWQGGSIPVPQLLAHLSCRNVGLETSTKDALWCAHGILAWSTERTAVGPALSSKVLAGSVVK